MIRLGREIGERLWPEWYTEDQVTEARSNPYKWLALYQQRPSPETGDYFKAEWLVPYDKAPDRETLRVYGGTDFAVTSDGGDFTCHAVVGLDPEGQDVSPGSVAPAVCIGQVGRKLLRSRGSGSQWAGRARPDRSRAASARF